MNGVEQHASCIWISLFIGAGLFILSKLIPRVLRSWGVNVPKTMMAWQDEVERTACEAIRADLYAAQCRAALVELIGQVPSDFDPTALFGCQVAAGIHKAAILEAEQRGIISNGTYERVYGSLAESSRVTDPKLETYEEDEYVEAAKMTASEQGRESVREPVRAATNVVWIGGRLVPRKKTA